MKIGVLTHMNFSLRGYCLLMIVTNVLWVIPASAELRNLPDRENPRPETTDGIPHIQIDVEAVPELSAQLLLQVSKIAGVELRGTVVGRSGSTGFWLHEDINLTHPEAVVRGREFAHLHPDGSLHASLPPELAVKAIEAGWAIHHPWAAKKQGMKGFVMIYTPVSMDELEVVLHLIMESYAFVTGIETASTDR